MASAAGGAASSAAAPADDAADHWDLSALYPSVDAWNADAAAVEAQLKDLAGCPGHLGDHVKRFKDCLDLNAGITQRYARLSVYASLLLDQDTSAAPSLDLQQRAEALGVKLNEGTSFLAPELIALGEKKVNKLLAKDASLGRYRHPIDQILRAAPHTLDTKGEKLIAAYGLTDDTPSSVFSLLSNADLQWPKVKLANGSTVRLDPSAYTKYRSLPNRSDRKRIFDAFFGQWSAYQHTFGATLYAQVKADVVHSSVRSYPDTLSAALDGNRIPIAVYDTLIAQARAGLPVLQRYLKLRARMLGLRDLKYYDLYVPIVHGEQAFPLDRGETLVTEAVKPLGDDYAAMLSAAFASRWMDVYPRPHKRSGAYMNGAAYDVHPFLLMNYNGDYDSVSAIAHEWGHAMHTVLANRTQPYITSDYPIFLAEIASTLNEALLLDHMLKTAGSDSERLYYLGSALENLRTTFFRQALFAEFERTIHASVEAGETLTGESLSKTYGGILRDYYGAAQGVVTIDEPYTIEWAYIPHFYSSYYVYQYATSIAASSMFAQQILAGDAGVRERYLNLLRAGGSDYPYDLLKAAGVDLATPAPYEALFARMNGIMDRIEAILDAAGRKGG
jgi:oligoendopeptidase F